ncbi:hypothetical protein PHYSODRAFT_499938, partial [Phytophthora sojae]
WCDCPSPCRVDSCRNSLMHLYCNINCCPNMRGLMRFVNHSCQPVAKFVEVANGRRTTVVVASPQDIHRGKEVIVDYDDLWFVCRCGPDGCRHRNIQDAQDP